MIKKKSAWKAGWRVIGGKRNYYRSRWEANYARYLELQRVMGSIRGWEHEPDTFWFDGIKRGVRSYLPDFRVCLEDMSIEYHEVKGYMDSKSKTKIKRMAKYYPDVKLVVIDQKRYSSIAKTAGALCGGWE